ncbi:MAG: methyltransferase [Candidatus Andeanibacterium colombiense]|uniref:Methyltransferase n=1 Tax=Candidatus Andeanibacterium colombiense TaxID=3121345 RepID=A0AAJ6BPW3_9SPHN|nr:MAG: methyltransferase [Sphingomonadaceae bacterium]
MKKALLASLIGVSIALAATPAWAQPSPAIAAAVADSGRPDADKQRDLARKPAEIIDFAGVKPGDKVAEMIPGGGYYTRILAKTVGPQGHVYLLVPPFFAQRPGGLDGVNALAAAYPNVSVVVGELSAISLPEKVDLIWTTENYHDMHNGPTANPGGVNKSVYDALKPGGIYFVEDHAAAAGAGTTVASTLHRIEPAAAIAEVEAAGFKLDDQTDLLKNPEDAHDKPVFDASIKGETDKFAVRFKRP